MSVLSCKRWYEECGEVFFTQLIISFSEKPLEIVKSFSMTCHFIYDIYKNCNDLWRQLLIDKYSYQKVDGELLEKSKVKLMAIFFSLEKLHNPQNTPKYKVAATIPITKRFCHTLTGQNSYQFNVDTVEYSYDIERCQFTLLCDPFYEESEHNYRGWDEDSDGLIFIFVIDEDFKLGNLRERLT